jgi:hypothetical protein
MSDDTPTERFSTTAPSEEVVEERKSRRLITILAIVGGALLLAVLIVLILLLTKGTGTPTAATTPTSSPSASPTSSPTPTASATPTPAPTPTPTATATATPPPPPPSTDASIDAFTINGHSGSFNVDCSSGNPNITLKWSTSNADRVYFGIDTADASSGPFFSDIPMSGNSDNDFPDGYRPFQYSCGNGSHKYVFTAVNDNNGTKDTVSIKVNG